MKKENAELFMDVLHNEKPAKNGPISREGRENDLCIIFLS